MYWSDQLTSAIIVPQLHFIFFNRGKIKRILIIKSVDKLQDITIILLMKLLTKHFSHLTQLMRQDFGRFDMPEYKIESGSVIIGGNILSYVVIKPRTSYDVSVISAVIRKHGIPTIK